MTSRFTRRNFLWMSAATPFLTPQQGTDIDIFAGYDRRGMGEDTLLNPSQPFRSAVGQPGWRGEVSYDLVERARLALEGTLTQHIREDGLPYFEVLINYATGQVSLPKSGTVWDHVSQTGRSVNAILCARDMTGDWKTGIENEAKIRKVLLADIGEDGFSYNEQGVAMMHDQNRVLLGLTNWYLHSEDERERQKLKGLADRLVQAFARTANKQGNSWSMPGMYYSPTKGFYSIARAPGTYGRTIMPLTHYASLTGSEEALGLATNYANHVLNVSDSFRFDKAGNFVGFGDEAVHVHSVVATVAGLILLGTVLGRADLLERGRAIYDYGVKLIANDFGWIPEANPEAPVNKAARKLRQTTCEGCCITDYIESAVYLAKAGYPEYWTDVEKYVRNHLLENQMTTVSWVKSVGPVDMGPRVLGSFSARSSPNRLFDLYHLSGPIGCCNAANVRALHLAWKHGLEQEGRNVKVNLLFNRDTSFARVETELPRKGAVRVTMKTDADLYLRLPGWARQTIKYQPAELAVAPAWKGPYHLISGLKRGQTLTAEFRLPRDTRDWFQNTTGITYRTEWLGDTIVAISPPGNCFPLYERRALV